MPSSSTGPSTPLTQERKQEIRDHLETTTNWSLGNLAARDLLAELDRINAELNARPTGVEYAVRVNGAVMNIVTSHGHDDLEEMRDETEARTGRYSDAWPDAEMVQRTAYYGPWTATER
ncbi:hypothetical protein [Streptomyces nanshensis]|uniref:Uncharacterized protein n=1 Tax=Streptomyces nanshensis TaxID=518642 RepID=A0A1E7LCY4_9ACTN|nr:hypothetical protein [Streptomyces nanshensis]OEV14067.1 hypothetical protein AN218_00920 [Streptomyces nanshensis]